MPLAGGVLQKEVALSRAENLKKDFRDVRDLFQMDIVSAYPGSGLEKLVRTFVYGGTGAGSLAVTDDYGFSSRRDFELALTTLARWKRIAPDKIEFDGGKEKIVATIKGDGYFEVKSETIE